MNRIILNVGIPRTATTYVSETIRPNVGHGHYTIGSEKYYNHTDGKFHPLNREQVYVVGFVRNPFDLLVSHYRILWEDAFIKHPHATYARYTSFPSYVRALWSNRIIAERGVFPRNGQTESLFFQLWTNPEPNFVWKHPVGVDYLGRYETLEEDLRWIAAITGTTYTPRGRMNQSSRGIGWEGHYRDLDFRREFAYRYRYDLRKFGYNFEGITEPEGFEDCAPIIYGPQPHPKV